MLQEKNKINWLKNIIAAVTIVALWLAYAHISSKEWQHSVGGSLVLQIIPDLIAALIAVIVVYYFFVKRGISSEDEIAAKIYEKLSIGNQSFDFNSQSDINREFDMKTIIKGAKEVLILGYSCRYLVAGLRPDFVEAMSKGTNIRLITIQPNSDASKLLMQNQKFKEIEFDLNDVILRTSEISDEVRRMNRKRVGKLEFRFINWIPSCSMIFIIPKSKSDSGILRLKVYAPNNSTPITKIMTHLIIKEKDKVELYQYFREQFEGLWQKMDDDNK